MRKFFSWLFNKASRDTTTGQFIPEIDGLRFIAIFSVIFYHLAGYVTGKLGRIGEGDFLAYVFSKGFIGVQLFFVISGFVIALPFAKAGFFGTARPRLSQYFFRRLTRLEPPYIANLVIIYILLVLVNGANPISLLPNLIASMLYVHNLTYGAASAINNVAWSLEIELQFYALAPLLTMVFSIRSDLVRRLVLVVSIGALTALIPDSVEAFPWFHISIIPFAKYFLSGFLLLDFYLKELPKYPEKKYSWDIVSLLAWSVFVYFLYSGHSFLLVAPIPIAYYASFKGILSNRIFTHPITYTIGGMCYTIYLYHFQLISAFGRLFVGFFKNHPYPVWLEITLTSVAVIPLILLISTFLFILIEKPCMRRGWYLDAYERMTRITAILKLKFKYHGL
jgi:peptidoglycan/LPS O-acetylase OafA/YrhL